MGIELIPVGKVFASTGRTISEGEFGILHSLVWNTHELHTDKEFMKSSIHGERILLGPLVVACMFGLELSNHWGRAVEDAGFRGIGLLGMDSVRIKNPVLPGDTLTTHTQILECRASRKNPKRIIVPRKIEAFNQRGDLVAEVLAAALYESTEQD